MSTCIPAHALLSALALRVEREGYVPAERDLSALLRLGVSADEIAAAVGRSDSAAAREAIEVLRRVAASATGR